MEMDKSENELLLDVREAKHRRLALAREADARVQSMLTLSEASARETLEGGNSDLLAEFTEAAQLYASNPAQAIALQLHGALTLYASTADQIFQASLAICPEDEGVLCCVLRPKTVAALQHLLRKTGLGVSDTLSLVLSSESGSGLGSDETSKAK